MVQKSLKADLFNLAFWTVYFFCGYLIIGYLIDSNFLKEIPSKEKIYEIFKDSLSITAAFLAPVAAFVLFSDWREQHNKSVRNEFSLKVFNQFEKFEIEIHNAGMIWIELNHLLPEEFKNSYESEYIPRYLNNKILKENEALILSFFLKIRDIQDEFNIFLDKLRYFGIASGRQIEVFKKAIFLLSKFEEISTGNEDDESYSEFVHLLEITSTKITKYQKFRDEINEIIINDLLSQLQENK